MLPLPARLYCAVLTAVSLGLSIALLIPAGVPDARGVLSAIGFGGLTALAWLHPVPLAFKRKLFFDTSVIVAAVLLLPLGRAALIIGAGTLIGHVLRREDWGQGLFNVAQTMLQTVITGLLLGDTRGIMEPVPTDGPALLAVTAIASVSTFLIGNLSVTTMIALETGVSPPQMWYQAIRNADLIEYLGHGAQVALGVAAALLIAADTWTAPIIALPALTIYGLLQRTARLRWRAEAALQESHSNLADAQEVAHLGSWDWNLITGEQTWSDETYRILCAEPQSFRPTYRAFLRAVHPEDRRSVREAMHRALYERESFSFEHRVELSDGTERSVHQQGRVAVDDAGRKVRIVGTIQDVTDRKQLEAKLAHQAFHDPLTDLPNRAFFLDRLQDAVAGGARSSPVAVLFIDLDNFKVINDSLGHETGDQVLVQISQRLLGGLEPTQTVARFGGDEFVVLLETDSPDHAMLTARRILDTVRAPIRVNGHEAAISTSIGIALGTTAGADPGNLLRAADTALYHAKTAGRGTLMVFEPDMHTRAMERLHLGTALESAIERDELRLQYQPEVDLNTGHVIGVEALARWRRPGGEWLLPSDFIPLAEETGLILQIGRWILTEACRQGGEWQAGDGPAHGLTVSVNLSPRQIRQPGLVADVEQALSAAKFDPAHLKLEVTEQLLVEEDKTTATALRALRDQGVRIAIDDFGTGYSSLGYLRRLPIDTLKIDRLFVNGSGSGGVDREIVQAITSLAHTLGKDVTAEGIETAAQLADVRDVGCDSAQGFLFAPALDPADLEDFLAEKSTDNLVRSARAGRHWRSIKATATSRIARRIPAAGR